MVRSSVHEWKKAPHRPIGKEDEEEEEGKEREGQRPTDQPTHTAVRRIDDKEEVTNETENQKDHIVF